MDEELQPLPELSEEKIITPDSPDRFQLLFAQSQLCDLPLDDTDRFALGEMNDTLNELDTEAAGLAAVQIGYPKRIFMLRRNGVNETFINPVVSDMSADKSQKQEGCLSLPNMAFRISRPKSLTLTWFDGHGTSHTQRYSGFWARAVCHEMDHLNGTILAEHQNSVIVKEEPRVFFKHQEGSIVRDAAFKNRVARRRAKKRRVKR
jgi:peptide deformylase